MSNIFGRHTRTHLPTAVSGCGVYLIDSTGKRYLDGSGGAAVSCLGHSDPSVRCAIKDQLDKFAFAHTAFFTSETAEELADILIEKAPSGIKKVYQVSGGSEAVEAALKLARQYYIEIGQPERCHIISRRQSYHGNTLGALAAGGNAWRRQQFKPLLVETSHIAPCYEYRGRLDDETTESYGYRVANELEEEIQRLEENSVMAFIAEPVVGATSGAVPAVIGYFNRIREICDRHGVLFIADEVMCGIGRTGTFFAVEHENVKPDIVVVAKGLGAGYQPIGAMLCQQFIFDAIESGSGFFQHGHTYMGHPLAAAAAIAVLKAIEERDLLTRVQEQGDCLQSELQNEFGSHSNVGDIRGRGLFRAIEMVRDRESKQPFDHKIGLARRIKAAALEVGLICYPMSGTIDGVHGDHVLLAPPYIITEDQITELISKLSCAISTVLQKLK